MPELRDDVLEEAFHEGETLLVNDLVGLVEKYHDDGHYGAPVDLAEAYVERLAREDSRFKPEEVRDAIDERLAEGETWSDPDSLYDVGAGRVSRFPLSWHEALHGEDDVYEYVTFIVDALPEDGREAFQTGGQGPGVPRQRLVEAGEILGGLSQGEVKHQLEELGNAGRVDVSDEQHPQGRVRPT